MKQSDSLAVKTVENAIQNSGSDTESKILDLARKLLDTYSYSEFQTYPRPSHPEVSKQKDIYFTMVAILISLRTTLEHEQAAVDAFLSRFASPQDVMESTPEEIAELIRVAGMPDKKANAILNATKYVLEVLNNDWEQFREMPLDQAREEIMKIPGVGQKSADCLLELGLDLPTIVIDVNMLRVVSRLFGLEWAKNPDLASTSQLAEAKKIIEDNLQKDGFLYQIVHTMFLLHGKNICKSVPKCDKCQLREYCLYYKNSNGGMIQQALFEL